MRICKLQMSSNQESNKIYDIIIIAEVTNANINISKYFVTDEDIVVVAFVLFCILNPTTNEEVPVKKATTVRTLPVIAIAIGAPNLVGGAVRFCDVRPHCYSPG